MSPENKKKEKNWRLDAMKAFGNDQRLYKRNDFRCLKPSKYTPPENWTYYDMEDYRAAKTKDELENVKGKVSQNS